MLVASCCFAALDDSLSVCPIDTRRKGGKEGGDSSARRPAIFTQLIIGGVRRKSGGAKGGKEEWTKAGGWKAEFPRFVQIPTNMRLFPYLVLSSYMSCTARERSSEKGSRV